MLGIVRPTEGAHRVFHFTQDQGLEREDALLKVPQGLGGKASTDASSGCGEASCVHTDRKPSVTTCLCKHGRYGLGAGSSFLGSVRLSFKYPPIKRELPCCERASCPKGLCQWDSAGPSSPALWGALSLRDEGSKSSCSHSVPLNPEAKSQRALCEGLHGFSTHRSPDTPLPFHCFPIQLRRSDGPGWW